MKVMSTGELWAVGGLDCYLKEEPEKNSKACMAKCQTKIERGKSRDDKNSHLKGKAANCSFICFTLNGF